MDEAERCSRVGLIYEGELLVADTPAAVKAQMRGKILELRTGNNQKGIRMLEEVALLRGLVLSGDKIHVLVDDVENGERVIREVLNTKEMEILSLLNVRPSLEDAFVSIVEERRAK